LHCHRAAAVAERERARRRHAARRIVPCRRRRGSRDEFTSHFWKAVHDSLGTKLNFSTAYHPQTDGQTERINQILEDMLRACALQYGASWDKSLPYAEFSYNNSYQQSLKMAPFEALYGRKCRTPLFWNQTGETQVFGTDVLRHAEQQVRTIRDNLRVAQSRQKSYADTRRRELVFEVGDYVYLKVSPMRSVKRFNTKGKLAPRYVGPFKVIERQTRVARGGTLTAHSCALPPLSSDRSAALLIHPRGDGSPDSAMRRPGCCYFRLGRIG
jgi:hypothetical protein